MVDTPKVIGGREPPYSLYLNDQGLLTITPVLKAQDAAQHVFSIRDLPGPLSWNVLYRSVDQLYANETAQLSTWNNELETRRKSLAAITTTVMDMPAQIKSLHLPIGALQPKTQVLERRIEAFRQAMRPFASKVEQVKEAMSDLTIKSGAIVQQYKTDERETASLMAQSTQQAQGLRDLSQNMQTLDENVKILRTRSSTTLATVAELNKDDGECEAVLKRLDGAIARVNKATSEWNQKTPSEENKLPDDEEPEYLDTLQDDLQRMESSVVVYIIHELWRSITSLFRHQPPRAVGREVRAIIHDEAPPSTKGSMR